MKEAKLRAKQAQEMEVLQGRGARGRDQLKRAHAQVLLPPHVRAQQTNASRNTL